MTGIEYLVFEDALRDEHARAVFERTVQAVNDGTARRVELSRGHGFETDGEKILGSAVLEYALGLVPADEFDATAAQAFAERIRRLFGWHDITFTLTQWVEQRLCAPYFGNRGNDWSPDWQLRDDVDVSHLPESFFEFACYVAVGELKHGPSYASVSANRIFDWVTKLGSSLPARLKKHGTGQLPKELAAFLGTGEAEGVTAKANDALATIKIAVKHENAASYAAVLGYLTRLLDTTDFPRSYALEFRGPTKQYLPVNKLPRKSVNQLFACAVGYPELWPAIAAYARAAMSEYDWYTNLEGENCAMPGTFAVFALGIAEAATGGTEFTPLVLDYLGEVDGEHQSLHGHFLAGYIEAHGFDETGLAYLLACAGNIQGLQHRKIYPALVANERSLTALLTLRGVGEASGPSGVPALAATLRGEPSDDYAWRHALYAIWGSAAETRGADGRAGAKIVEGAEPGLRAFYEAIFA